MKLTELHSQKNIAYKVMAYNPELGRIIAGADKRQSFPLKIGVMIQMPGNGIYLSLDKDYVLTYYSELAQNEVLITFEFDPTTLITGNLEDRETEFSVPKAKILDIKHLVHDEELFEDSKYDKVERAEENLRNIPEDIWNLIENFLQETEGNLMWHGANNKILGYDMAIIKPVHKRPSPRNTPSNIHNELIRAFDEAGFKANRDDLFVTGDIHEASSYGVPGAVFPLGDYDFTWSPEILDMFTDLNDKNPRQWLSIIPIQFENLYEDVAMKYREKWQIYIKEYEEDIHDAIQNNEEVNQSWIDMIEHFKELIEDPSKDESGFFDDFQFALREKWKKPVYNEEFFELDYDKAVERIEKIYLDSQLPKALRKKHEIMFKTDKILWVNRFVSNDILIPWLYEGRDLTDVLHGLFEEDLEYIEKFKIIEEN